MAAVPAFDHDILRVVCEALAGALTHPRITEILSALQIDDPKGGGWGDSKAKRLYAVLMAQQQKDGGGDKIVDFIQSVASPLRFFDRPDDGRLLRERLNQALLFIGYAVDNGGKVMSNETSALVLGNTEDDDRQRVYGPGDAYAHYRDLRRIITMAKRAVFIIDTYVDAEIFDLYLGECSPELRLRLLTKRHAAALKPIITKFCARPGINFEARTSQTLHDRVIFIDDEQCWLLGQSIKDAAKKTPAYIVALDADPARAKRHFYEDIWSQASIL